MNWQPITSAPKDGTWILAHRPDWKLPTIAVWSYLTNQWQDMESAVDPTHWMPLSEPPKAMGADVVGSIDQPCLAWSRDSRCWLPKPCPIHEPTTTKEEK